MTRRALALLLATLLLVALGAAAEALLVLGILLFLAVAVLVVVDSRRAPAADRVEVRRECDRLFSVGATNTVTLAIRAPRDASLLLRDDAPARMVASTQLHTVRGSGSVSYTLIPRARGDGDFGSVHVRSRGPWGLGTRDFSAAEPQTVRVDADVSAVRVYEALARRGQLQELGVRTQRRRGDGTEFERVREAVPDDPLRFINWRATARTGRLMATELSPERDQPVIACIDHGRLMGVGAGALTKLDHAINAALLLLHVALRTGDRAGLVAFADGVTTTVEPRRGAAQLRRLLDAVGPLQPGEIEFVLHRCAHRGAHQAAPARADRHLHRHRRPRPGGGADPAVRAAAPPASPAGHHRARPSGRGHRPPASRGCRGRLRARHRRRHRRGSR